MPIGFLQGWNCSTVQRSKGSTSKRLVGPNILNLVRDSIASSRLPNPLFAPLWL